MKDLIFEWHIIQTGNRIDVKLQLPEYGYTKTLENVRSVAKAQELLREQAVEYLQDAEFHTYLRLHQKFGPIA